MNPRTQTSVARRREQPRSGRHRLPVLREGFVHLFSGNRARSEDALRFAVVLFLGFVIACGGKTPTAPDSAFLRFAPREAERGSDESATAETGQGQIAVRATLAGPDPCRAVEAELDQNDREVTLRVFVRPNGAEVCVQVLGRFAYDAVIEGLPRGTYVLHVVHAYPSTGWPTRTVLSQTVNVR
jgi:hypothetical protein